MGKPSAPRRNPKKPAQNPAGDVYNFGGDFRHATINIHSTLVSAQEVKELESLPPDPGDPPYLGLQYFNEEDADRFFGRELLTARLVNRLKSTRFLAVIGDSGSGKSSLVRAGVVPALKRGVRLGDDSLPPTDSPKWEYRLFTPSAHPVDALAAALTYDAASPASLTAMVASLQEDPHSLSLIIRQMLARRGSPRLFLVIDQFEEAFSQCHQEGERRAFFEALLSVCDPADDQPVSVLILMRADFYARLAQYDRLRDLVASQQEFIGAMTRNELFDAIVKPAALGNWKIQEGLVEVMLDDIGNEPGALPLLSHALLETWNRRRQRTMTLSGYTEAGGVRGAIARTAEAVFQQRLTAEQRPIARMIFLRLTELNEDAQDTRRRASFSELITRAIDPLTIDAVLSILVEARLVTTGVVEPGDVKTVEVAHEALIREWPTLRQWLEEDREGLLLHRQLTDAAADWLRLQRDPGALFRGKRLQQVSDWADKNPTLLSLDEQTFLQASRQALAEEQARERRYRQALVLRRVVFPVSAVTLIGVLVALFFFTGLNVRFKTPAKMNGVFNVAVAEFGLIDAEGNQGAAPGEGGTLVSGWVANKLRSELAPDPNLLVWQDGPELRRQNVQIGRVAGLTPAERAASAAALAERLNAQMVVFGDIDTRQQPARLKLEFWLAPQLDYRFEVSANGYATGGDLPIRDVAHPGIEIQPEVNRQASTLAWVALGLTRMRFGQEREALQAFRQAEEFAPDSAAVQFFIGRESLFLSDSDLPNQQTLTDEAKAAFRRAIALDPAYGNAYIGLGSVFFASAKRLVPPVDQAEEGLRQAKALVEQALEAYRQAESLPTVSEESGTPVGFIARLGRGTAMRLLAEIHYHLGDPAAARAAAEGSVRELEALVEPFGQAGRERYLAQTYQTLGTAYQWLGFLSESEKNFVQSQKDYDLALDRYARCVEVGQNSPDQITRVEIAQKLCLSFREDLLQYLGDQGGS